jgi:HD domain-containing protein
MSHRLREASLHVVEDQSLVVPVIIEGLPETITALGCSWARKRELHMTAVSAESIDAAGDGQPGLWDVVTRVASGRSIGPIVASRELRRVSDPDKPGLETLIVMVDAPGLAGLHQDLNDALGARLRPPPAHVTLYSTRPAEGIGIDDERQLAERAPELSADQQEQLRRAMRLDQVLWDDGGIPALRPAEAALPLGHTDPAFTPRVLEALAYAAHVHRDQRRKGSSTPYLAHLISVAALVAEDGGTETEMIGALLHDAAEDHGGEERLQDISRRFGIEVETIVRRMSDAPARNWRTRKDAYLDRLRQEQDESVLRVSNADKLHNARAILADHRHHGEEVWRRLGREPDEILWYYGELAAVLSARRPDSPLARELTETVTQLRHRT